MLSDQILSLLSFSWILIWGISMKYKFYVDDRDLT
jgi:hypothetical protein